MSILAPGPETRVYHPAELNSEVRLHIEAGFPRLWLSGEISNLARPASGHWYFTIKDEKAQIRCAFFRPRKHQVAVEPKNGDQVLIRGRLSLYEPRGDYQLIADALLPAGSGALQQAFAALKEKLEKEGLFAAGRKQPIPRFPQQIAIVTSTSGAAIRDMLVTIRRRWPVARVRLYPSSVQGEPAAAELIRALQAADGHQANEVIILGRGGGSMEDLQAFNDEPLARALAALNTPVVCGVGHEHDVTIADWVADLRAATPTAAAEAATPDGPALSQRVQLLQSRLLRTQHQRLERRWQQLDSIARRLANQHPARQLEAHQQRLNELQPRLERAWTRTQEQAQLALSMQQRRLASRHPERKLAEYKQHNQALKQRLVRATRQALRQSGQQLAETARALNAVSPLSVLGRGYALVEDPQGRVLTQVGDFSEGQSISTRFDQFMVESTVTKVSRNEAGPASRPDTNSDT